MWERAARVIYPPVRTRLLPAGSSRAPSARPTLCVSAWRRTSASTSRWTRARGSAAASTSSGSGPELARLRRRAGPTVRFLGWQPDEAVREAVARCRAFLFPGEEEFGIAPLEATAAGRPIIAYARGALTETVVDGMTGLFFREQTAAALIDALERSEVTGWSAQKIRTHALRFSEETFRGRDVRRGSSAALGAEPGGAGRVLKERRLWLVLALAAGDAFAGAVALIAAYFVRSGRT